MDFDAFSEGISPGGLRNMSEIKLLICYILHNVDRPMLADDLKNMLQYEGLANYFAVSQSISDLEKAGNIYEDEHGYTVTDTGREIAKELEITLPYTVRERAVNLAIKTLKLRRHSQENKVVMEKVDGGYLVSCTVLDGEKELMTTRLLVGDGMQAEQVKRHFIEDPTSIYAATLAIMTGDYTPVSDILKLSDMRKDHAGD